MISVKSLSARVLECVALRSKSIVLLHIENWALKNIFRIFPKEISGSKFLGPKFLVTRFSW